MAYKAEALNSFKKFKVMAEAEIKGKLRSARSDRGGEFMSKEFKQYCEENGILRQLTTPHTPQQNGVVERRNRTVMELMRSMLKGKKLPLELWEEAITTCVHVLNRSATKSLRGKTLIWKETQCKSFQNFWFISACKSDRKFGKT